MIACAVFFYIAIIDIWYKREFTQSLYIYKKIINYMYNQSHQECIECEKPMKNYEFSVKNAGVY